MKYFWAKGEGKVWDEWCCDPACCNPPGYHFFGYPRCCGRASFPNTRALPPSFVECEVCGKEWEPQPQPLPHDEFLKIKREAQDWLVFVGEACSLPRKKAPLTYQFPTPDPNQMDLPLVDLDAPLELRLTEAAKQAELPPRRTPRGLLDRDEVEG